MSTDPQALDAARACALDAYWKEAAAFDDAFDDALAAHDADALEKSLRVACCVARIRAANAKAKSIANSHSKTKSKK